MKKFYARKQENDFIFEGDELLHFNVLRCSVGEKVLCLYEDGFDYLCEVTNISKKQAVAKILEKVENTKNPKVNITIFQALIKGEKLDLIVQKLTELGISTLQLFESEFAVAKANNNKQERLNKITMEACKQCGRGIPLKINNTIKFKDVLDKLNNYDTILFANEKVPTREKININGNNIAIIVGSEGGFSDEEINKIMEHNITTFGLGSRILRAETACIVSAGIIGYMVGV